MASKGMSRWIAALGVLLLCLASGAGAQEGGSAPPAASSSDEYLIGAGDVLQIFVWRQPELSVTIPVRPDGKISTPLIEDLVAVGKTPTQLAREMEQALSAYLRSPQVNVIVQEFVGIGAGQIRVTGQALRPQVVPYRDQMTLLDVVIAVGGLTEFAAGNRSRVIRTINGKTEEIRVRLDDLVNRGKIEHNITMRPGDILIIPERLF
jgi:polysaccharide export outer membrane protein